MQVLQQLRRRRDRQRLVASRQADIDRDHAAAGRQTDLSQRLAVHGSLNCTVISALIGTAVPPLAGLTAVTCGAVVLGPTPVVKL